MYKKEEKLKWFRPNKSLNNKVCSHGYYRDSCPSCNRNRQDGYRMIRHLVTDVDDCLKLKV